MASTQANFDNFITTFILRLVPGTWFFLSNVRFLEFLVFFSRYPCLHTNMKRPSSRPMLFIFDNLKLWICPGDMFYLEMLIWVFLHYFFFFFPFGKTNSLRINMLASTKANLEYFMTTFSLRLVPGTCFFLG